MTATAAQLEHLPLAALTPYAKNARTHSAAQLAQLVASIQEFGFTNPVLIDAQGGIVAGHGRYLAAQQLGMATVPCLRLGHLSEVQKRAYILADNQLALGAGWDEDLLALELSALRLDGFDLELTGFDGEELDRLLSGAMGEENPGLPDTANDSPRTTLADRFGIPPFSVINAREGWWQDRKRAWLALGIQSELGRGGGGGTPPHPPTVTRNPDGTLNYGGTSGQHERFDRQKQGGADMGQSSGDYPKGSELLPRSKKATATPGRTLMPAMDYSRRQRGDGRGRIIPDNAS